MKNNIIYSDSFLGNFDIQDLIYFLQDILNKLTDDSHFDSSYQVIIKQLEFIIDILNENI